MAIVSCRRVSVWEVILILLTLTVLFRLHFSVFPDEEYQDFQDYVTFMRILNSQVIPKNHSADSPDKEYSEVQDYATHIKILNTRVLPQTQRPRTCNNCNAFNFKPIIKPANICAGDDEIELLVLVTTVPKEWEARQAVRETWGSFTRNNTSTARSLFLLGGGWGMIEQAILDAESVKYGDILQDDYKDAYFNLSYKMISGYKWALKECPRAKFILRTAEDNFINLPRTLEWVISEGPKNKRAQIGYISRGLRVHRKRDKKIYVSYKEFPEIYYPDYAVGTAFLYSMEAVGEVVQAAPNVPFFAIEDAWFGMVMREIKMKTKDVKGFHRVLLGNNLKMFEAGLCPLDGVFYSLHHVSPEDMRKLWRFCTSANTL